MPPPRHIVVRIAWQSRHNLHILPPSLLRDYFLLFNPPPTFTFNLFQTLPIHLHILSIHPSSQTQVQILPPLPPLPPSLPHPLLVHSLNPPSTLFPPPQSFLLPPHPILLPCLNSTCQQSNARLIILSPSYLLRQTSSNLLSTLVAHLSPPCIIYIPRANLLPNLAPSLLYFRRQLPNNALLVLSAPSHSLSALSLRAIDKILPVFQPSTPPIHTPKPLADIQRDWFDISNHLGGISSQLHILRRVFLWPQTRQSALKALNFSPPRFILLYGPPGTGKTALVRLISQACGLHIVTIDAKTIATGEVGESERRLRAVLHGVKHHHVVFADEAEALLNAPRLARVFAREVKGIVVAASNQPWKLDKAVWDRFEIKLQMMGDGAVEVYERKLGLKGREKAVLREVAQGLTAVQIVGGCRRALMRAVQTGHVGETELKEAFDGL